MTVNPSGPPSTTPHTRAVFTVSPGTSFLDTIASALLAGVLPRLGGSAPDTFTLPDITVLLPTRRAARGLRDAFLRAGGGGAMLLPQIRAISDGDEDRVLISGLAGADGIGGRLDIPPAVSELERRLAMTTLVQHWSESVAGREDPHDPSAILSARTPAQALQLATELCQLFNMVETEGVSLDRLKDIVPDELSDHWAQTLQFLEIVTAWWPEHLAAIGKLSPADRRNRLVLGEARDLTDNPPAGPVIVAGVTGSIPATTELMQAVVKLKNGAIVLPGLDLDLDAESWDTLADDHPVHPQFGLARLLRALDIARSDVQILGVDTNADRFATRMRLVSETMRPAPGTHRWHQLSDTIAKDDASSALADMTLLSAPTAQDEAEAIALILREVTETPGQTAALVSPDRILARRVAIRLEGWGIRVDDSAGRPFAKTVPGSFLDLTVEVFAKDFSPKPLANLLKHPLTRLGMPATDIRRAARALEIIAFRTAYLGQGLAGLDAFIERADHEVTSRIRRGTAVVRLRDEDWQAARNLVDALRTAYAPLEALRRTGPRHDLKALTDAHVSVAEALAARDAEDTEASQLWRGDAGETVALLLASLRDDTLTAPQLTVTDYPDVYRTLIGMEPIRPTIPAHPRISIWGPFEARLQRPDVTILGGLNEGTWPASTDPGPWLNRPMRSDLGLPLPEERIGHTAHDFTQLLGADRVYLTRSQKMDGNPTVPSRWLLRLEAVLNSIGAADELAPRRPWLGWARYRDVIIQHTPIMAPSPRPALHLRPRTLSASAIETWIRNPYELYARRILALDPLAPLGEPPGPQLRGTIIHEALGRFAGTYPDRLPEAPGAALERIALEIFDAYRGHARIRAFWIARFKRFADWFGETEPDLRRLSEAVLAEVSGKHVIDAPAGPFTMTARADRIDVTPNGVIITDYKSGANLDTLARNAKSGRSPQLILEAIIALASGFANVPAGAVDALRYISVSGGAPPGAVTHVGVTDIAQTAREMEASLRALIATFDDADTPYTALRRAAFSYRYDDYAHLARVAEWSQNADNQGDE